MSTLAQPSDLQTLLDITLDTDRAQLVLDMVEGLAAAVVYPLPDLAKPVILSAAARAFPNPSQLAAQSAAGMSATWSPGGVYLTRAERASLRRMGNVGAGAFSVNTAPRAGCGYVDSLRPGTVDERERFALDEDLP